MEDEEDEVNFFTAENILAHVHGAKSLLRAVIFIM